MALKSVIFALVFFFCLLLAGSSAPVKSRHFTAPEVEDITTSAKINFFIIYGDTAKSLIKQNAGSNFIFNTDYTAITFLSGEASPTGKDLVNLGEVTFVIVSGSSARTLRAEAGPSVSLIYLSEAKLLILLSLQEIRV